MSCSSSRGSRARAFRQSPAARADAGTRPRPRHQRQVPGQRDHRLLDVRIQHQRHQHDHADHECPGQQPFPFALHEPPAQHRPLRDLLDHARPGPLLQPVLQRPQPRVASRAALRLNPAVPRRTTAGKPPRPCRTPSPRPSDPGRAPDHQRRPVTVRHRPPVPQRRCPRPPAGSRPSARPGPGLPRRSRQRHATRQGTKTQRLLL